MVVDRAEKARHSAALYPRPDRIEADREPLPHASRPTADAYRDRPMMMLPGPGQNLLHPLPGDPGFALLNRQAVHLVECRLSHEPAHDAARDRRVPSARRVGEVDDDGLARPRTRHRLVEDSDGIFISQQVVDAEDEAVSLLNSGQVRPAAEIAAVEVRKCQRAWRRRAPLHHNLPRSVAASGSKHPRGIAVTISAARRPEIRPEARDCGSQRHAIDRDEAISSPNARL